MLNKPKIAQWARWLTLASSVIIVLGIAPSQILLGAALLAMILAAIKPELPPIKLPLGLFLLGTLVAVALSGDPMAGFPQVKKFYVFTQLIVAFTFLCGSKIARWLVIAWAACGAASALLGVGQFALKAYQIHRANQDFYHTYMGRRITGFMSHWYTFSVEEMIVLLMVGAFLLFSPAARKRRWLWSVLVVAMALGLLLAETRSVWIATVVGAVYLIWYWRPLFTLAIPVLIGAGLLVAPATLRERATSIVHPGADDSNSFRAILTQTGLRMIKAHPWFGLGPEMPRKKFMEYLAPDTPRPLPSGSYMHLHNLYLEYAAERGIPVLLIMLWLLGKIIWNFAQGVRKIPPGQDDRRFILHGAIAVILALLVEGFADVNLGDSEVLTMFLVVVALGYNALRDGEGEPNYTTLVRQT